MLDTNFWYALRLNLQGNLQAFWLKWGADVLELAAAAAIAVVIYILVTPEKYAPDHREENKQIRRNNRKITRAATRIQSYYRGNKARGKYRTEPGVSTGAGVEADE